MVYITKPLIGYTLCIISYIRYALKAMRYAVNLARLFTCSTLIVNFQIMTAMPSGLSPLTQLATEPLDAKTESLIKSI